MVMRQVFIGYNGRGVVPGGAMCVVGAMAPQILADQLTLSQPGGQITLT